MKISEDVLKTKGIAYVQKFDYDHLDKTARNGKRHYETPDGRTVPSVTTILSATKDMTHLHAWRKRIGEAKAQQITTESANIGTVMHRSLEKHVKGEDRTPGSNLIQQKAHGMANVIIDNGLNDVTEVWGSEVSLHYPELYAGTTDLVGVYKGETAIMDFKQTNKPKRREWIDDYFLQLAAYGMAHNHVYGTAIQSAVILMCSVENVFQRFFVTPSEYQVLQWRWLKRVDLYYKNKESGVRDQGNL